MCGHKFRVNQVNTVENIQSALNENNYSLVLREAHTLKDLAGNIGATVLQNAAEKVEMQCQPDLDNEQLHESINEFDFEQALEQLDALQVKLA